MAAKTLTMDRLKKALDIHVTSTGQTISEGESDGQKRFLLDPGSISCSVKDGRLICSSQGVYETLVEIITFMEDEPATASTEAISQAPRAIAPSTGRNSQSGALVSQQDRQKIAELKRSRQTKANPLMPIRDIQVQDLSLEDIKGYLCPKANDQEAFLFLKLCQARGMNPFLKEAYLIKYSDSQPATMVVGKEHFTKTAEKNSQFDGFEAGIILKNADGLMERREGTFLADDETLIGGWAKVWRKDRSKPFVSEVALKDFIKKTQSGRSPWDTMPAVMIRKVPLVQSLREAFPGDLAGCYDKAEMDQAIDAEYEVQA